MNRKNIFTFEKVSERKKRLNFHRSLARPYFWRTTAQQEVDYLEVTASEIRAFEFKWSDTKKARLPKPFSDNYYSDLMAINKTNFRNFVNEEMEK
ncbi:MAG: hypothetical protein Q4B43_10605 [Bacteroidota bacterium]|nr:hypothetical protein [Bacteroidota bacterium]